MKEIPIFTLDTFEYPQISNDLFPDSFPSDLRIGDKEVKTTNGSTFGILRYWSSTIPEFDSFSESKEEVIATVELHTHGIRVIVNGYELNIHNSQIIQMGAARIEDRIKCDKSVSDRAVMGAAIAGAIGATIGALSGIGRKNVSLHLRLLYILYWDIENKCSRVLSLNDPEKYLDLIQFIDNWNVEKEKNLSENRIAIGEATSGLKVLKGGCLSFVLLVLGITSFLCAFSLFP